MRDIKFPTDVSYRDFLERICAAMDLNPNTAQLGWKSNNEPKRASAHQLSTQPKMRDAFQKLVSVMGNPRRYKEAVMEVIPLVSLPSTLITRQSPINRPQNAPAQEAKKNQAENLSYARALRIVQGKLRCMQHPESNRWCYINPDSPNEHIALGREEINLWA